MTKLGVRPEAEIDAFEAALWYESARPSASRSELLGAAALTLSQLYSPTAPPALDLPAPSDRQLDRA